MLRALHPEPGGAPKCRSPSRARRTAMPRWRHEGAPNTVPKTTSSPSSVSQLRIQQTKKKIFILRRCSGRGTGTTTLQPQHVAPPSLDGALRPTRQSFSDLLPRLPRREAFPKRCVLRLRPLLQRTFTLPQRGSSTMHSHQRAPGQPPRNLRRGLPRSDSRSNLLVFSLRPRKRAPALRSARSRAPSLDPSPSSRCSDVLAQLCAIWPRRAQRGQHRSRIPPHECTILSPVTLNARSSVRMVDPRRT
jgi:hypothetical protein